MMDTEVKYFDTLEDGRDVHLVRQENPDGTYVEYIDYGATIRSLGVKTRDGSIRDVVIGFDDLVSYQRPGTFGCVIGRVANRIGNGRFTLDGREYSLYINDGPNTLHGGKEGFYAKIWDFEASSEGTVFSLFSPDGDEGFPGNFEVKVSYEFKDNALTIGYSAVTDSPTVVNLTNHSYFDLDGKGDILGTVLKINADRYTESDEHTLPTGRLLPVAGTVLDFTEGKTIGKDIDSDMTRPFRGFDHNFVLSSGSPAAEALSADGLLGMKVYTDRPGMQLYTGNFIRDFHGKGRDYGQYSGFCLETQFFPDSPNHPEFPSCVLRPGEEFSSFTSYRFF